MHIFNYFHCASQIYFPSSFANRRNVYGEDRLDYTLANGWSESVATLQEKGATMSKKDKMQHFKKEDVDSLLDSNTQRPFKYGKEIQVIVDRQIKLDFQVMKEREESVAKVEEKDKQKEGKETQEQDGKEEDAER